MSARIKALAATAKALVTKTTEMKRFGETLRSLGATIEYDGNMVTAIFKKKPPFPVYKELYNTFLVSKELYDSFVKAGYTERSGGTGTKTSRLVPTLFRNKENKINATVQVCATRPEVGVAAIIVTFS